MKLCVTVCFGCVVGEGKVVVKVGEQMLTGMLTTPDWYAGPVKSHALAVKGVHSVQCTVFTGLGKLVVGWYRLVIPVTGTQC